MSNQEYPRVPLCSPCHFIHLPGKESGHGFRTDCTTLCNLENHFGKNFSGRQFNDCDEVVAAKSVVWPIRFSPADWMSFIVFSSQSFASFIFAMAVSVNFPRIIKSGMMSGIAMAVNKRLLNDDHRRTWRCSLMLAVYCEDLKNVWDPGSIIFDLQSSV